MMHCVLARYKVGWAGRSEMCKKIICVGETQSEVFKSIHADESVVFDGMQSIVNRYIRCWRDQSVVGR